MGNAVPAGPMKVKAAAAAAKATVEAAAEEVAEAATVAMVAEVMVAAMAAAWAGVARAEAVAAAVGVWVRHTKAVAVAVAAAAAADSSDPRGCSSFPAPKRICRPGPPHTGAGGLGQPRQTGSIPGSQTDSARRTAHSVARSTRDRGRPP